MEFITSRAKAYIDWCRSPVLPEEKFGADDLDNNGRRKLYAALIAEFLGLFIFQVPVATLGP